MNKTLFILITSYLLFLCHASKENTSFKLKKTPIYKSNIEDKLISGALHAYVIGDKKGLSKRLKWAHKILCLQHLFTPSGLHLTSIFLLIRPILGRKISFLLLFLPFWVGGFWAIKRICLLRITKLILGKVSWFWAFIISFTLDFFLGTFNSSPLSFCFSYLFLGLILSLENRSKKLLPLVLLAGQILVAYFWQGPINLLGVFTGQLLTMVFSFLFPIFFLGFWFPNNFFLMPVNIFLDLVIMGAKLAVNMPRFFVGPYILMATFVLFSSLKIKVKLYFLIFIIATYSPNLFNLHPKNFPKRKRSNLLVIEEKRGVEKIKRTIRGYTIYFTSGRKCRLYLFNTYWKKKCS